MRGVRWGATRRAVAFGVGLAFLAIAAGVPVARASGQDVISIQSPTSWAGPVDTLVTMSINESSGSPYTLSYTITSPDSGGCASAQPMPGVGPITTSAGQGGWVTFHWPAQLGHGQYYFCADPAPGGSGGHAASHQPYTVLNDTAPAVRFNASSPIQAGTSIIFQVTDWMTSDGQTLPQVGLLPPGAPVDAVIIQGPLTANAADPATGSYTYQVTISPLTPLGTYTLVVEGECANNGAGNPGCPVTEQSPPFTVLAAPTPTLGPTVTPLPLPTATRNPHETPSILSGGATGNLNQGADNTLWYVGGAGVGLAGLAGGAWFFLLRRRRKG